MYGCVRQTYSVDSVPVYVLSMSTTPTSQFVLYVVFLVSRSTLLAWRWLQSERRHYLVLGSLCVCFIDVWILDFLLRFDCLEQLRLINFKREQELRAINESVFRWMIILRSRTTPCGHSSRSLVVKSDGQIQACFARWRWGEDETFRRKRMCRTWFITSYDLTVRVHTPKSKLQSHVSAQAHVDGFVFKLLKNER